MNRLQRYYWTAKGVGWDNLPRRVLQALRIRSGWLAKKLQPENFSDANYRQSLKNNVDWMAKSRHFFKRPSEIELKRLASCEIWQNEVGNIVDKILGGDYIYFSRWHAHTGWPVDFNYDPINDVHWPTGEHWLSGDTLEGSDIKLLWEPNRFSAGYYFARQFARTGDMKYSQKFWELFDAWIEQNPPQLTRNWACGQENVFRLMGMLFGAMATLGTPEATEKRLDTLARLAWQTAKHVSININYAQSQGNNHSISEAAGLVIVGTMFEEFAEAGKWRKTGLSILQKEMRRQVMSDGSYAQHSMTYHRVVLDDLLWVFALLAANDIKIPEDLLKQFTKMTKWLAEMVDPSNGKVPNYGPNDGANVLPLSCCDFTDYRPTLQACWWAINKEKLFEPGPWDEKKLWLFGAESLDAKKTPAKNAEALVAPAGGYYIMHGPTSKFFTRCHTYKARPTQNDMLHVDLWYKGKNILRDGGSYKYNCPPPWGSYFASTAGHNTIEINSADQMVKGPRFLWFNWTRSKMLRFNENVFIGEHYGYQRFGVTHKRSCVRHEDAYIIVDELIGNGSANIKLLWRLIDAGWAVKNSEPGKLEIEDGEMVIKVDAKNLAANLTTKATPDDPTGWESLYFGEKNFCPHITVTGGVALPAKIITLICPAADYESLPPIDEILSAQGIE